MRSSAFPNLDGLVGLAKRDGVDIRPTLLRVLTDLFIQKPTHSSEEERHYTELAIRLIEVVDVSVRAAVSVRLATHPDAPAPVIRRLAHDVLEVAEPVLRHARHLNQHDLLAIAQQYGSRHAQVIATRPEFLKHEAVQNPPPKVNPVVVPDAATVEELSDLFFAANSADRRLILLNLDYAPIHPATPIPPSIAHEACLRLEMAALQRNPAHFSSELERALVISHAHALRIVADLSGEPIVIAAKALAMDTAMLQRISLFLNPTVGQSVERVYALTALFQDISLSAVLRLLTIWRETHPKDQKSAHQPYHWHSQKEPPRSAMPAQRPADTARAEPRRNRG